MFPMYLQPLLFLRCAQEDKNCKSVNVNSDCPVTCLPMVEAYAEHHQTSTTKLFTIIVNINYAKA